MSLFVSVNGGDRVAAEDVILYDNGTPIAAAMQHGNIVLYADSVRDHQDLIGILQNLGVNLTPARRSGLVIAGNAK